MLGKYLLAQRLVKPSLTNRLRKMLVFRKIRTYEILAGPEAET